MDLSSWASSSAAARINCVGFKGGLIAARARAMSRLSHTAEGLAEVKAYADGIGPWKPQVVSWKISPFPATNDEHVSPFASVARTST